MTLIQSKPENFINRIKMWIECLEECVTFNSNQKMKKIVFEREINLLCFGTSLIMASSLKLFFIRLDDLFINLHN